MNRQQPKKLEAKPSVSRYGTNPVKSTTPTPNKPLKMSSPAKSTSKVQQSSSNHKPVNKTASDFGIADEQGMMDQPRVNKINTRLSNPHTSPSPQPTNTLSKSYALTEKKQDMSRNAAQILHLTRSTTQQSIAH